jgi:hypothetical protein
MKIKIITNSGFKYFGEKISEDNLFIEIPKFLKYLTQLPEIDFSKSRMVFTAEEIQSNALYVVKEESKSGLYKELDILFEDFFNNNPELNEFYATPLDIKNKFFLKDNTISANYIRKVIKNEYKLNTEKLQRYSPFDDAAFQTIGTPFIFKKLYFGNL